MESNRKKESPPRVHAEMVVRHPGCRCNLLLVLEKVYPDGGYETELVDFYLVNPETLEVIDEQKSSW